MQTGLNVYIFQFFVISFWWVTLPTWVQNKFKTLAHRSNYNSLKIFLFRGTKTLHCKNTVRQHSYYNAITVYYGIFREYSQLISNITSNHRNYRGNNFRIPFAFYFSYSYNNVSFCVDFIWNQLHSRYLYYLDCTY